VCAFLYVCIICVLCREQRLVECETVVQERSLGTCPTPNNPLPQQETVWFCGVRGCSRVVEGALCRVRDMEGRGGVVGDGGH